MAPGEFWRRLHAQERRRASSLLRTDVPTRPGVYAWYRDGEAVYSGRAVGSKGIQGRVWSNHLGTGLDLSRSSFRRNVCEYLNIAATARTRMRPSVMTPAEVGQVNAWIRECEVAWLELGTDDEARKFERDLHAEWLPPLSKR